MNSQLFFFGMALEVSPEDKPTAEIFMEPNPMVRLHGLGPEGVTCKHCAYIRANQQASTYYKCTLRGVTHGAGTDHRLKWKACAKFRPEQPT